MVTDIINSWDPLNLFTDAPDNEYFLEMGEIVKYMNTHKYDEATLGEKIHQIFVDSFEDMFQKSVEECIGIAKKIIEENAVKVKGQQ